MDVIQRLSEVPAEDMGGFRPEVTVTAKTLGEARRIVAGTRFLDPSFWLRPDDVASARFKLDAIILTKSAANANWMHHQATQSGIFSGDLQRAPSTLQIQGMTDVFASLNGMQGRGGRRNRYHLLPGGSGKGSKPRSWRSWLISTNGTQTTRCDLYYSSRFATALTP